MSKQCLLTDTSFYSRLINFFVNLKANQNIFKVGLSSARKMLPAEGRVENLNVANTDC